MHPAPRGPEFYASLGRVAAYLQGDWNRKVTKRQYEGPMLRDRLMVTVGVFIHESQEGR